MTNQSTDGMEQFDGIEYADPDELLDTGQSHFERRMDGRWPDDSVLLEGDTTDDEAILRLEEPPEDAFSVEWCGVYVSLHLGVLQSGHRRRQRVRTVRLRTDQPNWSRQSQTQRDAGSPCRRKSPGDNGGDSMMVDVVMTANGGEAVSRAITNSPVLLGDEAARYRPLEGFSVEFCPAHSQG